MNEPEWETKINRDQTLLQFAVVPAGFRIRKVAGGVVAEMLLRAEEANWLFTRLAADGFKPLPKVKRHACGDDQEESY